MQRYLLLAGCLALLLGLCLAPAAPADAFCIHNKTKKTVHVQQRSGNRGLKGYESDIGPGEHGCCNWKNRDCNKDGHKHSIVTFYVSKASDEMAGYCGEVKVKAGGWLDVYDHGDGLRCTAHYE